MERSVKERHQGEQRGKSQAARGRREKSRRREGGEYSRLVFHLITTEGPRAAVRHIFFSPFLFFFITNIN